MTRQAEIYKMLNVESENSINAMKESNIHYKDIQIIDEVWNNVVGNTAEVHKM